ncbi:MAG: hypothetical protein NT094_02070, partial [Candidatus Staskawiczbacteria bacterium]|nr:hypothetical protein [Candidatus Staskawiczbacteria bacterium]
PGAKLEVDDDTFVNAKIKGTNSARSGNLWIVNDNNIGLKLETAGTTSSLYDLYQGDSLISANGNLQLRGGDSGGTIRTAQLFIQGSTNNVGIGTSSPGAQLQVNLSRGAASPSIQTLLISRFSRLGVSLGGGGIVKNGNTMDILLGSYGTSTDSQTRVDFKLANGNTSTPDTNVMTLQGDGRVGIATTSPEGKLTVNTTDNSSPPSAVVIKTVDNGSTSAIRVINAAGSSSFALNQIGLGAWSLYDYTNTTWNLGITQKAGQVSIGLINPGSNRLYVAGSLFNPNNNIKSSVWRLWRRIFNERHCLFRYVVN